MGWEDTRVSRHLASPQPGTSSYNGAGDYETCPYRNSICQSESTSFSILFLIGSRMLLRFAEYDTARRTKNPSYCGPARQNQERIRKMESAKERQADRSTAKKVLPVQIGGLPGTESTACDMTRQYQNQQQALSICSSRRHFDRLQSRGIH